MAAQSIGEPGTQLTLRTFHTGGDAKDQRSAAGGDVRGGTRSTRSLPRVEELFEARKTPKGEVVVAAASGGMELIIIFDN